MITGEPLTGKYDVEVRAGSFIYREISKSQRVPQTMQITRFVWGFVETFVERRKIRSILDEIQARLSLVKGER